MILEDYEIISRLNFNLGENIKSYIAKNSNSNENYNLHTVPLSNALELKITERLTKMHPNLLNFIDFAPNPTTNLIYVVTEHISIGNLTALLTLCRKNGTLLSEEFICKIFQQILCALKTIEGINIFNLDEILFDDDYNVKFFDLNPNSAKTCIKFRSIKTKQMGEFLYMLCTLKNWNKKLGENSEDFAHFSQKFTAFLHLLLKDRTLLHKNIDKILSNSTLLLKSWQWTKDKTFIEISTSNPEDANLNERIKLLKIKEIALQAKEDALNLREQNLNIRETKIAQIEIKYGLQNKNKENFDTSTVVECGDSVINVKTARKLDLNALTKPATFHRSKSERRIRFKGHSPLKEINFNGNANRSRKTLRRRSVHVSKLETVQSEENSEKASSLKSGKSAKNLFQSEENSENDGYNPISWTEESKRHAFDLLRILNEKNFVSNEQLELKHTDL